MQNTIPVPQSDMAKRDALVELVNKHFDFSEKYFQGIRVKLPRLYDTWRGIYTGRFHPHKNNVHVPLIYAAVWSDAARKAAISLSEWPLLKFQGAGPNDEGIARKHESLISAQMKDSNAFMKEVNTHVCGGLYGTAISQVMWDRRYQHAIYDEYVASPMSTEKVRQIKEADIITFDGPNHENVDLLDWYPQPGFRLVCDMKRVGRRYYLDLDDVRFMASGRGEGRIPVFDPAEVERMGMEGSGSFGTEVDAEVNQRRYMARLGMSDDISSVMDKFSRPVEIRELWGIVPSELAINGETNVVLTVANRKYLLRARGNPFWHRTKPFLQFNPTPDPHYHFACGKAEVAEKLQITANRYVNQRLDAGDLVIDPQMFYDRNAGINTRNLYAKPGRWIGTDGPPGDKVTPLSMDLRGMQMGSNLTSEMMAYIERGTGITDDTVMGLDGGAGSDRQTAREFIGRREASGTRLMLESRIYEEQYFEPLANMYQRLNRQFLEGPVEVYILGDNARMNPDTGAPILDTREMIEGYELAFNYMARAMGATTALSKGVRQQNLIALLQAVQANPYVVGAINFVNFFRQIFREFDMRNVNELINAQPAVQAPAAAAGMAPGMVPDTAQGSGDSAMQIAQLAGQGPPQ